MCDVCTCGHVYHCVLVLFVFCLSHTCSMYPSGKSSMLLKCGVKISVPKRRKSCGKERTDLRHLLILGKSVKISNIVVYYQHVSVFQ